MYAISCLKIIVDPLCCTTSVHSNSVEGLMHSDHACMKDNAFGTYMACQKQHLRPHLRDSAWLFENTAVAPYNSCAYTNDMKL